MTPDLLYPPPPLLLQWLPCPVCNMLFKDAQGRGGHLRHMRDPAHTAYRAQHGLAKPKRSRYPDPAMPASPRAAPTPPTPPPDDEILVLDFGEPQQFGVLLEDEPESPEPPTPVSPVQQLRASPPASPGEARVPVAQAPALGASPPPASPSHATASPALPPALAAQAVRLALPEAANGYGGLGEAGEAPRQGDSNAPRQATAPPPQAVASPSPPAQATPASSASTASPPKAAASPVPSPASPARAVRLASPEAPIRYGESGEAGKAGGQAAPTEARRTQTDAPARRPHAPAFPAQAAPVALGALSNALINAPPSPALGRVGRAVCLLVVLGVAGVALYLAVHQLKGQNDRTEQPHFIEAAKLVPGAPPRRTGDPYWDHLLGYDR